MKLIIWLYTMVSYWTVFDRKLLFSFVIYFGFILRMLYSQNNSETKRLDLHFYEVIQKCHLRDAIPTFLFSSQTGLKKFPLNSPHLVYN